MPSGDSDGDMEAEAKEEPDEVAEVAAPADSLGESSDPVRLYLKEMGNFQLLSREQEVEIAKRIEAGENEVEDVVLRSPVTLDFVIKMGEQVMIGDADLRDIFEENEEPSTDPDEERGSEANEKQLKKLEASLKKLTSLRIGNRGRGGQAAEGKRQWSEPRKIGKIAPAAEGIGQRGAGRHGTVAPSAGRRDR